MPSSLHLTLAILILRFIDEVATSTHSHSFVTAADKFPGHVFVPEPVSYGRLKERANVNRREH